MAFCGSKTGVGQRAELISSIITEACYILVLSWAQMLSLKDNIMKSRVWTQGCKLGAALSTKQVVCAAG